MSNKVHGISTKPDDQIPQLPASASTIWLPVAERIPPDRSELPTVPIFDVTYGKSVKRWIHRIHKHFFFGRGGGVLVVGFGGSKFGRLSDLGLD